MMQKTLADAKARGAIVERLEQLANEADPGTRLRVYEFLVKAHAETAAMGDARRRWFLRIVELSDNRGEALRAAVEGAVEMPERPRRVSRLAPHHAEQIVSARVLRETGEHGFARGARAFRVAGRAPVERLPPQSIRLRARGGLAAAADAAQQIVDETWQKHRERAGFAIDWRQYRRA